MGCYMMGKLEYIKERFKKINYMMNNFIEDDLNIFQKALVIGDLGLSILVYGAGITDYFQYQFYKRRPIDKNKFIVHRKRMRIVNTCNDKEDREIFNHKSRFNEIFTDYIGRDWKDLDNCTYEEFCDFAKKHKKFIVKPMEGSHGKGIYFETIDENSDLNKIYEKIKSEKALIEEIIVQNDEIAEFNPSSVNTLRVVTLLDKDNNPRVMTANLRMGRGDRVADNFHHHGIASLLDVETGIVKTSGIDGKAERYLYHPISGKQIVGFKIPYWEQVTKTVKEAAKVIPTVRYVGWDVAVGKDGRIYIVEGNSAADPDISQLPDQIGKWPLYEPYINDIKGL